MKSRLIIACIVASLLSACGTKKDKLPGTYVARNTINTIDTIVLLSDGNYTNKLYRATDKSLIYINTGKWKTADGYITFENFYTDNDDIHSKEGKNFEAALMTQEFQIESRSEKIIIHHIPMFDEMYLERID